MHEDRIIRIDEVCGLVALGKSAIYKLARDGKFPRQIALTKRARGWRLSEIQAHIARLDAAA